MLTLETIATVASAVQAVLLVAAAVIAWRSLRASRAAAKFDTVIRYFERYWAPEFVRNTSFVLRTFGLPPGSSAHAIAAHTQMFGQAPHPQRLRVYRLLNFWEELGTVYCGGLLDNELILTMFAGHSIQMWDAFKWLVESSRAAGGGRVFDKWEVLQDAAVERDERLKLQGK